MTLDPCSHVFGKSIARFLLALFACATLALLSGGDLRATAQDQRAGGTNQPQQPAPAPEEDPDLPTSLRGRTNLDKAEYLRLRADHISLIRGFYDDPLHARRSEALREMEVQLRAQREGQVVPGTSNSVWTAVGPAPIPNGQTTGRSDPVSGRTISIAVDPTDPNIVYVGTAQGGLYRSVNGGTTWTPLMDSAQSLAIGALALAPSNPDILYVGTGESNFSADSYIGVGVYRIDNARTTANLVGPFNPPVATGLAGTDAFTGRAISEILVHPTDPATIFVATASGTSSNPSGGALATVPPMALRGVYRSTNATSASPAFTKLAVPTAAALFAVPGQPLTTNRDITDLAMEPGNPNVLLAWVFGNPAAGDGGVFRSADALAASPTFTHTFQSTILARGEFAINKVGATVNVVVATGENPQNTPAGSGVALCTAAGNQGVIRTSADGGGTWSAKRPGGGGFCGGQCTYDIAVEMHPANPTIILLGGSAPGTCSIDYMRSTNGGATEFNKASNLGLHADSHALAIARSNPNVVYIGNDGGIWKSTDNGVTWASLNNTGFNATQFQDMALHPTDREFMIGGTQDNGTEFKQANGVWKRADFGDGGHALIDQSAADTTNVTMYHTYFNQSGGVIGFARTRTTACANEGQWAFRAAPNFAFDPTPVCPGSGEAGEAANGIIGSDSVLFYAPMALGPGTPNSFYFGTDKLYRDGATRGNAMVPVSQDFGTANEVITSIGISRTNDTVRIVGLRNGTVFATTTGANPMTNVTAVGFPDPHAGSAGRRPVTEAIIDPNNTNTAYVAFGGYVVPAGEHIWKTANLAGGAATWVPAGAGIPDVPVNALVIDPANTSIIYAGTDIGVYRSLNGGTSWAPFSDGMPRVAVFDLEIQNLHRILRAVTHGRGMWEVSLSTAATALPGISDIPDQIVNEDTAASVNFVVGASPGNVSPLVVTVTSANQTLVPNANLLLSGSGTGRTLAITPAANKNGTAEITVTVTQGAVSNSDSFILTVNPVPDPPVVTITSHPATTAGTSPFVTLRGTVAVVVADAAGDGAVSVVTWSSNRGPTGTATGTTNWLAEVPLFAGANIITVSATDAGGLTGTAVITMNVSSFIYYFAEGATGSFFDLELGIANPNAVAAPVQIQYLKDDGTTVDQTLTVGAQRRETILVDGLAGLTNTAVSAVVTSTSALPLGVERTMRWDATGYGAHTEKATSGAQLQWFFAEGSQGFFDTFILLANPQTTANVATVTFLRETGAPVTKTYNLLPTSRTNVHTASIPELVNSSFGVTVTFNQPGVAERAMYFGTPLFNGGHESAGVNDASTSWFLAEGAVGDFFDTFVLVSNPNPDPAAVTFTFLRDVGAPVVQTQTVAGNARFTLSVDSVFPGVTNGAVATQVTADRPVVAERAMYWPGGFTTWYEAHNAFGVTATARRWALGEGRKGGPEQYETYILLANPGATPAAVTITYLREGSNVPVVKNYTVPATSRFNVAVNSDVPEIASGERFGALIDSSVPIAVERALYSSANGVFWAAGTNATATKIP